jgi:hypothetical protein
MNNANIDKLTKELMSDSKLKITNPAFDDLVMNQILFETSKLKKRKDLFLNILIFTGIEFILFALILALLLYFPGYEYFTSALNNSMLVFEKIGNFVIKYDYLILSFLIIFVFDRITSKKATVSVKY